jgi:uncharacterized protein (DUF697 family)
VNVPTLSELYRRLERVVDKLPHGLREPLLNHLESIRELFEEGQLQAARESGDPVLRLEAARKLVKSSTALCSAIGAQPLPLADFPFLTTVQMLMIGGVIYISGQRVTAAAIAKFLAALGVNVGAALVLREGARALLKFVPIWGDIVSGAVAGAGTYAIGRAATAVFIEGVPIEEARKIARAGGSHVRDWFERKKEARRNKRTARKAKKHSPGPSA